MDRTFEFETMRTGTRPVGPSKRMGKDGSAQSFFAPETHLAAHLDGKTIAFNRPPLTTIPMGTVPIAGRPSSKLCNYATVPASASIVE